MIHFPIPSLSFFSVTKQVGYFTMPFQMLLLNFAAFFAAPFFTTTTSFRFSLLNYAFPFFCLFLLYKKLSFVGLKLTFSLFLVEHVMTMEFFKIYYSRSWCREDFWQSSFLFSDFISEPPVVLLSLFKLFFCLYCALTVGVVQVQPTFRLSDARLGFI